MEVCKREEINYELENYYENIFTEINEVCSDYETLEIGIEVIKLAKERLNSDLDNESIRNEYNKLGAIIKELEDIKNNYV